MRVLKRSPWLSGLGLVLVLALFSLISKPAAADVASDQAGSIVIFPKVIADGTRDTLIELSNTANTTQYAHCFYVNAGGTCEFNPDVQCAVSSDCPLYETANEHCIAFWQEDNFDLQLTKQQPTIWRASTGRIVNPTDPVGGSCSCVKADGTMRQTCPGIDPGNIIPAPAQPFRGELKCILVDESGAASNANALKGEAIIETLGSPQISKYNSINILAVQDAPASSDTADLALKLNNSEYNACPKSLEVVHYANGAGDIVLNALDPNSCATAMGCPVFTQITLIPCTEDLEDQVCVNTIAQFAVYDEQETPVSASMEVACWNNSWLGDIGDHGVAFDASRGTFLRTHIQAAAGTRCIAGPNLNAKGCTDDDDCGGAANGGVCGPAPGLLAVVEEVHVINQPGDNRDSQMIGSLFGTAATNVHMVGQRSGFCRGNPGDSCESDADCTSGLCRKDGTSCDDDGDCDTSVPGPGPLNRCDLCIIDSIDVPEVVPSPVPAP
jgi:hypothetical protein